MTETLVAERPAATSAAPRWRAAAVVGASSGIGAALGERLAAGGTRVALLARRGERLEAAAARLTQRYGADRARAYAHDVTDGRAVPDLFRRIARDLDGLDLLIYAAGQMPRVGRDEYDADQDRRCIDVNLLGAVAWLNEAATYFRDRGAGTIVGISSIAGDRGRGGNPAYGASKAGLTNYLESLRHRLHADGVTVCTVKPGFVDTPMTAGLPGLRGVIPADRAAALILRAAARRRAVAYVPARWRLVSLVVRAMPGVVLRRLKV